jgi:hypothetical protein
LSGLLNLDALAEGVTAVINRHDALRTRIVAEEGVPTQVIGRDCHCEVPRTSLQSLPESLRERAILRRLEELILEPVDLSAGPLWGARLLTLADTEHVLILGVEHIVADALSLDILVREIFTAYAQLAHGKTPALPPVDLQFSEYAVHQQNKQGTWLRKHGAYWDEHLRGCSRIRLPAEPEARDRQGWGTVPICIDRQLRTDLHEWCRSMRTSPSLAVFTAYAALLLRWYAVPEAIIRYQGSGRSEPGIQHAVGFFASRLYLRLRLQPGDRFAHLLERVTEEYCNAYEHDDWGYLETRKPTPECASNPFFNWIPQGGAARFGAGSDPAPDLVARAIPFANPWFRNLDWDNEPMTLLYDQEDTLHGGIYFSRRGLSDHTMQQFAGSLVSFVGCLARHPQVPIADIRLL